MYHELQVIDVYQEEYVAKDCALRDSTNDKCNEGMESVDDYGLCSSEKNMIVQPDSEDEEDSGDQDADEEGALIIPKDWIGRFISSQFEDDS